MHRLVIGNARCVAYTDTGSGLVAVYRNHLYTLKKQAIGRNSTFSSDYNFLYSTPVARRGYFPDAPANNGGAYPSQ